MIARIARAALFVIAAAFAAPPLTTIQDVLYKADGSRFNGIVVISWSSFEAPDTSNITTQSLAVKVTDGSLRARLVPTTNSTPAMYYSVKYNSDGKVQFEETWAVPASQAPLRVRDVRVPAPALNLNSYPGGAGPLTGPIEQSEVTGLTADLGARPLKAPGYAAGRVVFVNQQGALESVTGDLADCVRVDGSSGTCGAVEPAFMDNDSPSGIVDGNNPVFTLAAAPNPAGSLALYRNGMLLKAAQDFNLSASTVTFLAGATPQPGDTLLASYRVGLGAGGAAQSFPAPQVLCSGVGGGTNAAVSTSLGLCTIPSGLLVPGDRVEVRFDLEHQGTASGYVFDARWGGSSMVSRNGGAADAFLSGRAEAALHTAGAQVSSASWGSTLPFSATSTSRTDAYNSGIVIEFFGHMNTAAGDTLTLKGFTVVRYR